MGGEGENGEGRKGTMVHGPSGIAMTTARSKSNQGTAKVNEATEKEGEKGREKGRKERKEGRKEGEKGREEGGGGEGGEGETERGGRALWCTGECIVELSFASGLVFNGMNRPTSLLWNSPP